MVHGRPAHRRGLPALRLLMVLVLALPAISACTGNPSAALTPTAVAGQAADATADPDSSSGAEAGSEPPLPIRAAFYYQWFPEGWRQAGLVPYTVDTPSLGFYDSGAPETIRSHVRAMRFGNITAAIASWWGPNEKSEQTRVPALLEGAAAVDPRFRIALYYEKEGVGDPSVQELTQDLAYIATRYAAHANYLRIGGRPVLFVYNADDTGCAVVNRWKAANADFHFYLDLKVVPGWASCAAQPDGWHQYAPAESRSEVAPHSTVAGSDSISPGFSRPGPVPSANTGQHLPRDLHRWSQAIRDMVRSRQPWQLVTTFNEWGEGTAVESAVQWGTPSGYGAYLDLLHTDGR